MTTQFICIDNTIINLQLITSVSRHEDQIWIHFDHDNASVVLEGKSAEQFWKALQCSSLNLTPKSPQLPVWDAAK